METRILGTTTERAGGWTHYFKITNADCTAGATTQTLQLIGTAQNGMAIGDIVRAAAFYLATPFVGTALTNLTMQVGYDLAAGTDDPDAFIKATELLAAGRILAGDGNGDVFATLRTGYAFQEAGDLEVLLTATGGNLSAMTAGEVRIYLQISKLASIT